MTAEPLPEGTVKYTYSPSLTGSTLIPDVPSGRPALMLAEGDQGPGPRLLSARTCT